MITTVKELNDILRYEHDMYCQYMFPTSWRRWMGRLKQEPLFLIMQWQAVARKTDYYKYRIDHCPTLIEKLKYFYFIRKRNLMGCRLGIEAGTENTAIGLMVYHFAGGLIINGSSIIGRNCHFHGNNCIGNAGPHDDRCPILGNDVMVGVGAKIIGNVRIADRVKIAAGAVVVHDILEEGCTVAGIPARIINHAS